jgi:hypothetical protein
MQTDLSIKLHIALEENKLHKPICFDKIAVHQITAYLCIISYANLPVYISEKIILFPHTASNTTMLCCNPFFCGRPYGRNIDRNFLQCFTQIYFIDEQKMLLLVVMSGLFKGIRYYMSQVNQFFYSSADVVHRCTIILLSS